MKVKELIEKLKELDQDLTIHIADDWFTEITDINIYPPDDRCPYSVVCLA